MTYRESVLKNISDDVGVEEYLVMGALGLCGEAGEVVDLIKKHKFQGAALNRDKLIKELGDVRWYLEVLFHTLNTSISEVEDVNMIKLRTRYPNGFTVVDCQEKKDESQISTHNE